MVDIVSIGVHSVIDQNYRRKVQLGLFGLFLAVSIATAVWFIFPASQSVLTPFLLPAIFLLFTLSMGYYTFLLGCDKKSVINNILGITEPAESVKRVHCQEKIQSLLGEVRSITRDKFCDTLVDLCFEDRKEAHKLALYVKEIEGIISTITNEDLLCYFDQFFTMIEISDNRGRGALVEFARECRKISEIVPNFAQKFVAMQAKFHPEGYLCGWLPKPAEIVGYGALISLIPSQINSFLTQVSEVNNDIRLIT
ncbi:hypothetical protein [Wolbachia endosymbiont of Folsomia candida]|uniref:hypothetical protein n=1 Tax=Wolbachia endosymbiont of Folsomia candida TaxID=169402 RepID=UPI000A9611F9|nr:hypothetical protein [Wolbachia endosymbiont of Folsomia candida]